MNDKKTELAAALVDVRRAYRLLHGYQRRVNDLFYAAHEFLIKQGLEFESWGPLNVWSLPRKNTPFFRPETWAWDLTPAYQVECVWRRSKNEVHHKIHIHAIADTGYNDSDEGEPNPAKFEPAEASRSELRIGLYRTRTTKPDWSGAWEKFSVIANRKGGDIHRVNVAQDEYAHRYFDIDLAELGDEHAVKEKLLRPIEEWSAST